MASSIEKKLETIVRLSSHHGGGIDYHALDTVDKDGLMLAANHRDGHLREIALLHLKSRFLNELTSADLASLAPSLNNGDIRLCLAAADIYGARMSQSKTILVGALRGKNDLAAVCAASGLLNFASSIQSSLEKEAMLRMLNCLIQCSARDSNAAVNYLINHPRPSAVPWFEQTLSDAKVQESARQEVASTWTYFVTKDSLGFAVKLLQDSNPAIRVYALRGLRPFMDEVTVQQVLKLRHDDSVAVRKEVFADLKESNNQAALPAFLEALSDDDLDVFSAAVGGIEALSAQSALPRLVEFLRKGQDGHGALSGKEMVAGKAVAKITGKDFKFSAVGFCGNMYDSAYDKIERGKFVGGQKGKVLIAQGEKEKAEMSASKDKIIAEAGARSVTDRDRLLLWWDSPAAIGYPHR